MSWYDAFNAVEAGLWGVVAVVIAWRTPRQTSQQWVAVWLAGGAFLAFSVTDLLELGRAGDLPLWLWGLKIACGVAIFAARFLWLGWKQFSWHSREVRFGLACLFAVLLIIALQHVLNSSPRG